MASVSSDAAPPTQITTTSVGPVHAADASSVSNSALSEILGAVASMDVQPTNTVQVLSFAGNSTTMTNANTVQEANDNEDEDASDEELGSEWSSRDSDYDSDGYSVDYDEKDLERANRLYETNQDGEIHWVKDESSYTFVELLRRGPCNTALIYDVSSSYELREYVKDRKLVDPYPQGLTLKYFYISVLEEADKSPSFRFLDLTPEMRNRIYTELLTFLRCTSCPAIHEVCDTTILRTNKQVYKEARDILYADNEIPCMFTACGGTNYYDQADFYELVYTGKCPRINRIYTGMKLIPDWFHRIHCLRIDLDFEGGNEDSACFSLQSCLLNLASFLMGQHCLKKLSVHVHDTSYNGKDHTAALDAMVYPLRRLRGIKHVEITGISKALEKEMIADMEFTTKSMFNTMLHLVHIIGEAEAYLCMVGTLNPSNDFNDEGGPPPIQGLHNTDDVGRLVEELGEVYEWEEEYNPFADAKTELNTRRKMEDLKDCLARVKLDNFDRRRRSYLVKKAERDNFLATAEWVSP